MILKISSMKKLFKLSNLAVYALVISLAPTLSRVSIAQTASIISSIVGTVTDATGAAIPGAQVTVTNPLTNSSHSAMADAEGFYRVSQLTAGSYTIGVKKAGFKDVQSSGITLISGQTLRLDYKLEIGSVGQTVTVAAQAALIETQNPEVTTDFDAGTRKYLATMVPSFTIMPNFNPATTHGNAAGQFSYAGSLQNEYDYEINGMTFTKNGIVGVYSDWMDQQEVHYVNNDAQYQTQAVVEGTMKSGTNKWHGSIRDEYSSGGLESKNYFSGIQPSFVLHTFTSMISGPVIRDKMFFFAGWAGEPQEVNTIIVATVPTVAQTQGLFSTPIIDPKTGSPFAQNSLGQYVIPTNRISSVSSAFIKEFYPAPNQAGGNNFVYPTSAVVTPENNPYARVDYNISNKNLLFADWIMEEFTNADYSHSSLPAVGIYNLYRGDQNIGITDIETFTPNLLNEFGIGFARDLQDVSGQQIGTQVVQNIGLQGVPTTGITPGIPQMNIQGFTAPSQSSRTLTNFDTYALRDIVSWTKSRHTLKFGVAAAQNRSGSYPGPPDPVFGTFSFTAALPGGTGNALANFLLGLPSSESRQLEYNRQHFRYSTVQFFGQDSFEVSTRLTLHYGLRYEYHQAPYETGGQAYNVNLTNGNIILYNTSAKNLVTPIVLNNPAFSFQTAQDAGYPGHLYDIGQKNFAPRVGVAYRVNENTVVRSGYGLFYDFTPPQATPSDLFTVVENFVPNSVVGGTPIYQFPNPFSANPSPVGTLGASSYAPHIRMPYTQQWSLTVERQFSSSIGARLSYIGSHTAEQLYGAPANIPAPSTTPFTQSRRPLSQFGQMTAYRSGVDSNYNGLSGQLQFRTSSGIYGTGSYTWAKNLGIAGQTAEPVIVENPFDPRADYGNTIVPSDVATMVVAVPLPFGHGQKYFASGSRLSNEVFGGWTYTADMIWRSGTHLTPLYSGYDSTGTGILTARPDVIGNPNSGLKTLQHWYNNAAFAYPGASSLTAPPSGPIGRFGDAGVGIITGPSFTHFDMSVAKEWPVFGRLKVSTGILVNDVFNHPNIGDPQTSVTAGNAGVISGYRGDQDNPFLGGGREVMLDGRIEF